MRRLGSQLAAATTACLVMSGCSGSNQSGDEAGPVNYAENGTFTIAYRFPLETFEVYTGGIGVSSLVYLAYDSLVNQLPNGEFVSGLAKEWTADARSATFTLRPNVTCSDGTPLTASQVADAINYVSDPDNASVQYGTNTPTTPLTATGDDAARTVEVVMDEPYGFLLHTIGRLPIVCAKGLENPDMLQSGSNGTGPFVLTDVAPGQSYTFTVRDDYTWGPDGASTSEPGTPATVVVRVVENETTAANLLLSGELNLAQIIGPDQERLDAAGLEREDWLDAGVWLNFNQAEGHATADRRVREALVRALDLDEVLKVSTGGTGVPATGLAQHLEPTVCEADTVSGLLPEDDVAAAEDLLDDAGWTKSSDGIRRKDGTPLVIDIVYWPTASPYDRPNAEFLAEQWEQLGVQVNNPNYGTQKVTEVLYETSDWDVNPSGSNFALPSNMVQWLSGPTPPDGTNLSHLDNEEFENLAAKAVKMTPPEACTYWNRAERAIIGNLDIVPISNRNVPWYLHDGQAQMQRYLGPIPTSIRVLE